MNFKNLTTAVVMAMSLVACGNKANTTTEENNAEMEQNKVATVAKESATFDVFDDGKIIVDYTKPTFTIKEGAINPSLISEDGKVTMQFVSGLSSENYNEYSEAFQQYSSNKDYSFKELDINGFKAIMATYYDDDIISSYTAVFYIDFGDKSITNSYYGVKISARCDSSLDRCISEDVMSIVNSVRIINE